MIIDDEAVIVSRMAWGAVNALRDFDELLARAVLWIEHGG
jgi:hypothetical protein